MPDDKARDHSSIRITAAATIIIALFTFGLYQEAKRQNEAMLQRYDEGLSKQSAIEENQRAPLLYSNQCCNPTAIINVKPNNGNGPFVELPNTEQKKRFPSEANKGFVAKVKNVGLGVALNVYAIWIPERITDSTGTEIVKPETVKDERHFFSPITVPMVLRPGDEAEVRYLPDCITADKTKRITLVDGVIEFHCHDVAQKPYKFRYHFTAEPSYRPDLAAYHTGDGFVAIHIDEGEVDHFKELPDWKAGF